MKETDTNPPAKTIVECISSIVNNTEKLGLCKELFQTSGSELEYVSTMMNINERQALIFSLFANEGVDGCFSLSDFSRTLQCKNIELLTFLTDVEELEKKYLIRKDYCRKNKELSTNYKMPIPVLTAIKNNEEYDHSKYLNITNIDNLFDKIEDILDDSDEMDERTICDEIDYLINANRNLHFCKAMRELEINKLNFFHKLLFYTFCKEFIIENNEYLYEREYLEHFKKANKRRMQKSIIEKYNPLLTKKIIEPECVDGQCDFERLHLTDEVQKKLFPEFNIIEMKDTAKELIKHTSFAEKQLYYSPKVEKEISILCNLLQEENFANIQNRLKAKGMRQGFACLFYGSPGTGKTETVNQISRLTGRDVMMIDVSRIKSMWVGESEKNIKRTFDRYRNYVKTLKKAPILLFNEADAVLGIRQESAERAVDKMENSIQNIILQEMESLDGIMIATTNLTANLDKAFERRFLYKIEFERPTVEAKSKIWQAMIPNLNENDANTLARKYDLSGGEIENIVRKTEIYNILYNQECTLHQIQEMCEDEKLNSKQQNNKSIGFKTNN
ncbi:MAG: AAA family ATPase [Bacteroidales bacterium]|nr:AAA family ATPase [Bacteroidales bacterium]